MQKQSIASVYRDRDRWDFHPVGLFLSLHRPGFTLDTSLSYDLGMELQATFLCTTKNRRACQGFPETLFNTPVSAFCSEDRNGVLGGHTLTIILHLYVQMRCLQFRSELL